MTSQTAAETNSNALTVDPLNTQWSAGGRYYFGPNVEAIRVQATRVVRGRIPRSVRTELMAGVKAGALGRLPKDGLKPEVFFHPYHIHGARDLQAREAAYSVKCIAGVMASPAEVRDGIEAMGGDVLEVTLAALSLTQA